MACEFRIMRDNVGLRGTTSVCYRISAVDPNCQRRPVATKRSNHELSHERALVNAGGEVLVVVWTERDDGERLISVRRATAKERKDYEG
jgi:uncharacterized DUF497 family protein